MADYFLGALKGLERRSKDNVLIFSDVLTERLDALVSSMIGQKLSDNDYLKTLELYYNKYRRFENREGMYFCILRMQQILSYRRDKRWRNRFRRLEFSTVIDEEAYAFLSSHRDYYASFRTDMLRILLMILLGASLLFLSLSVLVFQIPFLCGWFLSIALYFILWVWCHHTGLDWMLERQIHKLYPKLDPLCVQLDQSTFQKKAGKRLVSGFTKR